MSILDERRRMMLDSGDNRFYIFKEGKGMMNGFTASTDGATVSASGMELTGSTIGNRVRVEVVKSDALTNSKWADYKTVCFEVASTNGTFNVGYFTYRYRNIPLYRKYQRFSKTSRTIIKFPVYTLSQLIASYETATALTGAFVYIGIFHTAKSSDFADNAYEHATGQGICYNIWLE